MRVCWLEGARVVDWTAGWRGKVKLTRIHPRSRRSLWARLRWWIQVRQRAGRGAAA